MYQPDYMIPVVFALAAVRPYGVPHRVSLPQAFGGRVCTNPASTTAHFIAHRSSIPDR